MGRGLMRGPTVWAVVAAAILLASCATLIASVRSADAAPPAANGKIVFASSRGTGPGVVNPEGDKELFTMDPDGTDLEQLTNNSLDDVAPAWSPDGTQIAFEREMPPADPDGFSRPPSDIYKMDTDAPPRAPASRSPSPGTCRHGATTRTRCATRTPPGCPTASLSRSRPTAAVGATRSKGWAPTAAARPTSPEGPPATSTPSGHPADDG
jgi:hypothetical protein